MNTTVYYGFEAPTSYILSIHFTVEHSLKETNLRTLITGYQLRVEDEIPVVRITFMTYIHENFDLTGVTEMISSYFNVDSSLLVLQNTERSHQSQFGWVNAQQWLLTLYPNSECILGDHDEVITLRMITSTGETEDIGITVTMHDTYRAECAHIARELVMNAALKFKSQETDVYKSIQEANITALIDAYLYIQVNFSSYILPHTVEMTGMAALENELAVCSSDCFSALQFVCEACSSGRLTMGHVYEFRVGFPSTRFVVAAGATSEVDMSFAFEFAYQSSRRRLTSDFMISDDDSSLGMQLTLHNPLYSSPLYKRSKLGKLAEVDGYVNVQQKESNNLLDSGKNLAALVGILLVLLNGLRYLKGYIFGGSYTLVADEDATIQ